MIEVIGGALAVGAGSLLGLKLKYDSPPADTGAEAINIVVDGFLLFMIVVGVVILVGGILT